ncbi:TRAFs-binding domain-containing protein [Methylobacterium sp. Leaf100]|uniref:TRAFs-binding domain-containing protein n=1 Tax=Methylobacterium sp. Leaf100 TaxID=1736252 RepID=UPI0019111AA2|nr:TRAFs-binding domain-containing protein [Methylobacterium sp. Leaf100]
MPFGKKPEEGGRIIDFDRVYREIIKPAVEAANLEPIRADEENVGGIIHKPMFERLMLCDYAVADLTTANANVFYELGIRHGVRPHSTVLVFGRGMRLPFDVAPLRGLPYALDANGAPESPDADRDALAARLNSCRDPVEDSPLFQLVTDWPRPEIARLKTDRFRELVAYSRDFRAKLELARESGPEAVARVESELDVADADPAIVVDLLLSYRAVEAWQRMVDLLPRMATVLARTVLVQEQVSFALNRLGRRREAEQRLLRLIEEYGPSSETNGLLGRVYKDLWVEASDAGNAAEADGWLRKAIATYVAGYEADMRDAYPGINAVTLLDIAGEQARRDELLPVVRYATRRRLGLKQPDYWDHATRLELSVLGRDEAEARVALADALATTREPWEPKSTARNLGFIRKARAVRGEGIDWIVTIEQELDRRAKAMSADAAGASGGLIPVTPSGLSLHGGRPPRHIAGSNT